MAADPHGPALKPTPASPPLRLIPASPPDTAASNARSLSAAEAYRRAKHPRQDYPRVSPLADKLSLFCGGCGQSGRYDVGAIVVQTRYFEDFKSEWQAALAQPESGPPFPPARDGAADPAHAQGPSRAYELLGEYVGFTRYFRCKHCDAGGPWQLTADARFRVIALMLGVQCGMKDLGLHFGEYRAFDGTLIRYPTEGEALIKDYLAREHDSSFLWTRLGNVYKNSQQPKLAEPAYRRAVELDPRNIEAHAMLAELLFERRATRKALPHYKEVLRHVRHAEEVPRKQRMELTRCAFETALMLAPDPAEIFELLPTVDPAEIDGGPRALLMRQWDLDNPRDVEDLCAVFVDGRVPKRSLKSAVRFAPPEIRRMFEDEPPRPVVSDRTTRNAPCPCGSGHKFKKCCGRSEPGPRRGSTWR